MKSIHTSFKHSLKGVRVAALQAKIRTDTRIEIKDQVLLTVRGYKLHPNDVLANLEKENYFQTTTGNVENLMKQAFV